MTYSKFSNTLIIFLVFGLLFSCKDEIIIPDPSEPQTVIKLVDHPTLGKMLVNQDELALYFFSKDVEGTSKCTGGCLTNWPAFSETDFEVGDGLSRGDFSVIDHPEGGKQVAFQGWPLYFYIGDTKAGDTNGEGLGGNWFVAKPDYDVMIAELEIDHAITRFLVDANRRALYTFSGDSPNQSKCLGACVSQWPVFSAEDVISPSTVTAAAFGSINHPEAGNQTAFAQRPLYYFANDLQAGDIKGQGVKNAYFVVTEDEYK